MWKMYKESKANLIIRLGGDSEIDVNDLAIFFQNTSEGLSRIINIYAKDAYFKLKFRASERGSIILDLGAVTTIINTLFNNYTAEEIINIFLGIVKIIKDLKGKPAKAINLKENHIENYMGEIGTYNNNSVNIFYSNPAIAKTIKRAIKSIENRDSIEYRTSDENKVVVEKDEMEFFEIEENDNEEITESIEFFEKIKIKFMKICFEGNSKWTIKYQGKTINATVLDKPFLDRIQTGEETINPKEYKTIDLRLIREIVDRKIKEKYYITKVY